jgi:hypothetical protein
VFDNIATNEGRSCDVHTIFSLAEEGRSKRQATLPGSCTSSDQPDIFALQSLAWGRRSERRKADSDRKPALPRHELVLLFLQLEMVISA